MTQEQPQYQQLVDQFTAIYRPRNHAAQAAVADIAAARLQMNFLNTRVRAICQAEASDDQVALLPKLNRELDRLQRMITRSERQIKFIHTYFPDVTREEQTEPVPEPNMENRELTDEEFENLRQWTEPIYTTEHTPRVIDVYRRAFPTRSIVILPTMPVCPAYG